MECMCNPALHVRSCFPGWGLTHVKYDMRTFGGFRVAMAAVQLLFWTCVTFPLLLFSQGGYVFTACYGGTAVLVRFSVFVHVQLRYCAHEQA